MKRSLGLRPKAQATKATDAQIDFRERGGCVMGKLGPAREQPLLSFSGPSAKSAKPSPLSGPHVPGILTIPGNPCRGMAITRFCLLPLFLEPQSIVPKTTPSKMGGRKLPPTNGN